MTKGQIYDKLGELLTLDLEKSSCGRRLIERDDALRTGQVK